MIRHVPRVIFWAITTAMAADRLACRAFVYRAPRDLVLDSLFGPAEEIEYTGTTAPSV